MKQKRLVEKKGALHLDANNKKTIRRIVPGLGDLLKKRIQAPDYSYILHHLHSPINLFDHRANKFLFVNDKFKKLTGLSDQECYTQELKNYGSWIETGDLQILQKEIGKRLGEIFNEYICDTSEQLIYQVNFRLKEKGKNQEHILVLAQCTVVEWTRQHLPAVTLNMLTDITHYRDSQKIILTVNKVDKLNHQWKTILKEEFLRIPQKLGKREKEIMSEMLKDKSATEISKEKKMSFFTVRSHWRNILQKTNCKTQKEFKHLAQVEGWL